MQSSVNKTDGVFVKFSEWGSFCPVTYAITCELVKGNINMTLQFKVMNLIQKILRFFREKSTCSHQEMHICDS